jgi:hypothetical protein
MSPPACFGARHTGLGGQSFRPSEQAFRPVGPGSLSEGPLSRPDGRSDGLHGRVFRPIRLALRPSGLGLGLLE